MSHLYDVIRWDLNENDSHHFIKWVKPKYVSKMWTRKLSEIQYILTIKKVSFYFSTFYLIFQFSGKSWIWNEIADIKCEFIFFRYIERKKFFQFFFLFVGTTLDRVCRHLQLGSYFLSLMFPRLKCFLLHFWKSKVQTWIVEKWTIS